jgi:hypothetical protein
VVDVNCGLRLASNADQSLKAARRTNSWRRLIRFSRPTIYAEPSTAATEKSPGKLLLVIVDDPHDPATQARVSSLLSQHGTSDGWI